MAHFKKLTRLADSSDFLSFLCAHLFRSPNYAEALAFVSTTV